MISLDVISRIIQATLSELLEFQFPVIVSATYSKFSVNFEIFLIEFHAHFAILPNCAMTYELITYIHSSEMKSY